MTGTFISSNTLAHKTTYRSIWRSLNRDRVRYQTHTHTHSLTYRTHFDRSTENPLARTHHSTPL